MSAWQELSEAEYDAVWDSFGSDFGFRPSTSPTEWPGITEPEPSITYSISDIYVGDDGEFDDVKYQILEKDLNVKTLNAFRRCTLSGDRLYALDWQHRSFWFCPHEPFEADDPNAWVVPVLPNGDYYIFLAEDFGFGLFGHPWEQTICVFGQTLLDAFEGGQPFVFSEVVRRSERRS